MNEWVWSNGGMILTGENWSTGGKTLYSVGGRWMNEWSNGGMILTGENWNTGRETLYSVCGRWMNEYGAMVEWNWQGKTEVLGEKHYTVWVVGEWMSVEQWWNDSDRGNWSTGRETFPSTTLSTKNPHIDWPEMGPAFSGLSAVVTEVLCDFSQLLQVHAVKALFNSNHDSFLSHSFHFIIRHHPTVRLCKAEVSDVACQ